MPNEYVWSDQYEWKIQAVGRTGSDDVVILGSEGDAQLAALYSDDGAPLTGALIVNWPRALIETRRGVTAGDRRAQVADRLAATQVRLAETAG